jgi:ABC-type uncharacterized transport system involved in gliding motility auxiliary subunit
MDIKKFLDTRTTLSGGTLLALALVLIGLTILFNFALRGLRIDLTQNHLYTTAPGTNRILRSINEPINLYFFFSEKAANDIPEIKTYGTHVRELLEELADRAGGKVRLHVIDPAPFSEDEDRATELGVEGTQISATSGQLYFGLAGTNSTDGKAPPIPFFDPRKEQFLEYDVVKLIYQLANPKKPVVGWLSGLPMGAGFDQRSGQMREPWMVYQEAEQLFEVKPLEPTVTQIDPSISVLVLVHPKNLAPATQFAIDQYALSGGHIALFVDPLAEADTAGQDPGNPMAALGADKSSNLAALLTTWGVQFDPKQVIADRAHALQVSTSRGGQPTPYLGWLGLDKTSFGAGDVVTAGLSSVNVATAGFLTPIKDAKTKFEPLLQTSPDSAPMPAASFAMVFDPASLRDGFKPTGQRYTIGARVSGPVKSAFPGGPPAGVTLPAGSKALTESKVPLNLVVFADTDMLTDRMWVSERTIFGQRIPQALAGNGDLVMNALDNLGGSSDLISVRGRATFSRPFERVEALRRNADDRLRATEQQLQQELRDTEEKLGQLQSKRTDKSSVLLTPEQAREVEQFQQRKKEIRQQLRAVRAGLDSDIQHLGNWIKVLNIIIIPVIFALAALLTFVWRRQQRPEGLLPAPKVQEAKS